MNILLLLTAMLLMWIAVFAGSYQRIFQMPRWFADPPASFELIRQQSRKARAFWIPLSALFMICVCTSLVLYWRYPDIRDPLLVTVACYGLTGILSGAYFVREVVAFTKIPADAPRTLRLMLRIRFWLRWTTARDVLQLVAALFITVAYVHSSR